VSHLHDIGCDLRDLTFGHVRIPCNARAKISFIVLREYENYSTKRIISAAAKDFLSAKSVSCLNTQKKVSSLQNFP